MFFGNSPFTKLCHLFPTSIITKANHNLGVEIIEDRRQLDREKNPGTRRPEECIGQSGLSNEMLSQRKQEKETLYLINASFWGESGFLKLSEDHMLRFFSLVWERIIHPRVPCEDPVPSSRELLPSRRKMNAGHFAKASLHTAKSTQIVLAF